MAVEARRKGNATVPTTVLVFVYGTLTDSERVERVLESHLPIADLGSRPGDHYEFVGRAGIEGLHRVEGRYPTLVPGGSVEGRLLAVDRAGLEALDAYEGVDEGLYVRVSIPLANDEGSVRTYVGDPARLGVEDASWPGDGPFRSRVVDLMARERIVAFTSG